MPTISVIIPTYNRAELLAEAIRAILRQTVPIHEILVIDDGSTDNTEIVVSQFSGPIKYVRQNNHGKAAALNTGISHCSGDYIWICDDDDIALENAAELLSAPMEQKSVALAFGRYDRFSQDESSGRRLTLRTDTWPSFTDDSVFVTLLEDCFIFQNACLVRKSAYDMVGPFRVDLLRSQDYEMTVRLAQRFSIKYVPQVVFLQRVHQGVRGPTTDRFDTERQFEKWLHYDKIFFSELYRSIPLSRYISHIREDLSHDSKIRMALIQRACICARKKLWDFCLSDLTEVARLYSCRPLSDAERLVCRRFLLSKFGCDEIATTPDIAQVLRSLASQNPFTRDMIRAVTAPLLWHVRAALTRRAPGTAKGFLVLLADIHGYDGITKLILASSRRHFLAFGHKA